MEQLVLETLFVAMKSEIKNRVVFLNDGIYISLKDGSVARVTTKKVV